MAEDCLFCSIVAGDIPAAKICEDEHTLAFADVNPQAPTHILVVPKKHLRDLPELAAEPQTASAVVTGIAAVARQERLSDFRTVFNTGAEVGQSVFHVHAHVLAGRPMAWPPG